MGWLGPDILWPGSGLAGSRHVLLKLARALICQAYEKLKTPSNFLACRAHFEASKLRSGWAFDGFPCNHVRGKIVGNLLSQKYCVVEKFFIFNTRVTFVYIPFSI